MKDVLKLMNAIAAHESGGVTRKADKSESISVLISPAVPWEVEK